MAGAIDLAPGALRKVPYIDLARQHRALKNELLAAVGEVLDSGQFILGAQVAEFEKRFAELCGARFAIGVGNGTDALTLTLRALGVGPGDEVITAANSFVASAGSIALCGATPVLVDAREDFNIDPAAAEKAVTPRTKALLPVHLTGRPADMDPLLDLAKRRGLAVVEDCAQAVLAEYKGRRVGSMGTAGAFSLHPLKTLNACGDGGVIVTNDAALQESLRTARNLGLATRDNCAFFSANSRLDTLQAAILLVKLGYLEAWTEGRRRNAALYRKALDGAAGIDVPRDSPHERSVYHTFMIQSDKRNELKAFLAGRGVETAIHYPSPIHLQAAAKGLGRPPAGFPVTERLASRILSLPVYPELGEADIAYVAGLVREFHR